MPHGLEQGHDDADDEEIVGVGEEAHAGDEHDLPMLFGDARVVHLGEVALPGTARCSHARHLPKVDARG